MTEAAEESRSQAAGLALTPTLSRKRERERLGVVS